jgi:hypothetical protein
MMKNKQTFSLITLVSLGIVTAFVLTQAPANAAGKRKADWKAPAAQPATPSASKRAAPKAAQVSPAAPAAEETTLRPQAPDLPADQPPVQDQSQEVLDNDLAMAALVASQGPKVGYGSALSDVGVLFDANGSSPPGQEAATARFGSFPVDVQFVRTPEKALAAGGSGSSWGSYTIMRGSTVLSAGRYLSVWRRETSGWKMVSELAAGKTNTPSSAPSGGGVLPKRPAQLGRTGPARVGVPLTIPTPPAAASENAQTPQTPPAP